jgi:hypothetical protein
VDGTPSLPRGIRRGFVSPIVGSFSLSFAVPALTSSWISLRVASPLALAFGRVVAFSLSFSLAVLRTYGLRSPT